MINRKWTLKICLISILLMIGFDLFKSYKEEKPPIPLITIGETETDAIIGPFKWNSKLMNEKDAKELLKNVSPTIVNPVEDLSIHFPDPKPSNLSVFRWDENYQMEFPLYKGKYVSGKQVHISNDPGRSVLRIEANWQDKKCTYFILLEKEQVSSYQELLSEDSHKYSILQITHPSGQVPSLRPLFENGLLPISQLVEIDNLEAKVKFPELSITDTPSYFVFNKKEPIMETNSYQEIIQFFHLEYKPTQLKLVGTVTAINKETHIVEVGGFKFYLEDIKKIKTGQDVQAIVTFYDLIDPLQTKVRSIEIIGSSPKEALLSDW